jgi:uncharacterized protein YqgQ
MAFSHKTRFLKRYGIPYYMKLSLDEISQYSGIQLDTIKCVYDTELVFVKKHSLAMKKVYSYANKVLGKQTNERN